VGGILQYFVMIGLLSVVSGDAALAGAWTQPKGQGLVILSVDHSIADRKFDDAGQARPTDEFQKTEIRTYIEYGLTDWATLVAQPAWRDKKTGGVVGNEAQGFGRLDVGLRNRIWKNDSTVLSIQTSVRAPGADDDVAPVGDGDKDWQLDGRVLLGHGFSLFGRHSFADLQVGYRRRFGGPADELRFDLTTGIDVTPKILAMIQSFNGISVGEAALPFVPTREHKVTASIVYRFDDDWSFQAGGLMNVAGRNSLQERGAFVGVWRNF